MSLGFVVSPVVLDLLVSKFDKTGGKNKAIEYDNFIEYVSITLVLAPVFIFKFVLTSSSDILFSIFSFVFFGCCGYRCCLTVKVYLFLYTLVYEFYFSTHVLWLVSYRH